MRGEVQFSRTTPASVYAALSRVKRPRAARCLSAKPLSVKFKGAFPHVWLGTPHLGDQFLRERFPAIHRVCANFDIDMAKDWIPVHPGAHYHCGGVLTDEYGRTNLPKLSLLAKSPARVCRANRLASIQFLKAW